tara:strand:+ start:3472 stop:3579 length:108 start_codon:yes stop_codon:yes gene_type:complete
VLFKDAEESEEKLRFGIAKRNAVFDYKDLIQYMQW